jgi:hypothetical protein
VNVAGRRHFVQFPYEGQTVPDRSSKFMILLLVVLVELMYAHWQVPQMTAKEQDDLLNWPRKGNEVVLEFLFNRIAC